MTFPHHDSAAFLEVAQVSGHYWYVRQTCLCHKGNRISLPFLSREKAEHCLAALDEVSAKLNANPLSVPSGRIALPVALCVRGDLRSRRRALDLTGEDLARQIGVHRAGITRAERAGQTLPMIARMEAALSKMEKST